ncbi:MAG: hypothetical protein KDD50_16450 [Bdellovibrionales bacterium]|nr:hypothetical protein [Bdellovibrionales bacterium]
MKVKILVLLLTIAQSPFVNASTVTEVILKSPQGDVETLRSDDEGLLEQSPQFKGLSLSSNNWYCRQNSTSPSILSRQIEKQFELDFLVKSLVNKKTLTQNQKKELRRTPDCKPFRFQLHVIAKVEEEGYRVTKVSEFEN